MDTNPNNIVSFVKKIVNKSTDGTSSSSAGTGGSSSSASHSSSSSLSSSARGRSSRTGSVFLPFSTKNVPSISSASRYSSPSTLRRASRAAETFTSVPGPSLNFKQIKDKVTSGSSKVMATFKSDHSSTPYSSSHSHRSSAGGGVASAMAASAIAAVAATTSVGGSSKSSSNSSSNLTPGSAAMARRYSSVVKRVDSSEDTKRAKVTKMVSTPTIGSNSVKSSSASASPIPGTNNEELISHLTEEERSILSKVFLKEEQFIREQSTALTTTPTTTSNNLQGNLSKLGSTALRKLSGASQVVTSSSMTTMSNLAGSPLLSPASSVASTSDLSLTTRTTTMSTSGGGASSSSHGLGNCRICRKNLDSNEKYRFCSTCSGSVCEDCSSYVSQSGKFFVCSSCRRKSSAIPDNLATDPGFLRRRSTMVSREQGLQGHFDPSQRRPSDSPSSLSMNESPIPSTSESPSISSMSYGARDGRYSADGGSSSRGCDSTMSNTSSRSMGHGSTVRSSSGDGGGHHVHRTSSAEGTRSTRRSLTASDSSPEDDQQDGSHFHRSSFKNRKRFSSQSSFDNDDCSNATTINYDGHGYRTSTSSVVRRPSNVGNKLLPASNMLSAGGGNGSGLRQTASEIYLGSEQNRLINDIRRKSDSPSTDMSCDGDWTRTGSPRQSGDGENVSQIRKLASLGQLPTQRRSIPSVLVDSSTGLSGELNYLSLKDCFGRRSSTGRALPKIPVEQSRSLLDLPGRGGGSSHSLDLPHDQPRRASAPEGENIRIVIDDVDSSGMRKVGRSSSNAGRIERIVLHRDHYDKSIQTRGFGIHVTGGKFNKYDGRMYTYVAWVTPSSSAAKMGLKPGDKILEWDGQCLVNCSSLDQVIRIIDNSTSCAELLIDPLNREERKGYFVHQRRRLSSQISISGDQQASLLNTSGLMNNSNNLSHSNEELGHQRLGGRKLPRPPGTTSNTQAVNNPSLSIVTINPEILIDFNLDSERRELKVTLISAKNLNNTTHLQLTFVRIQLFPKEGFEACQTEMCSTSSSSATSVHSFEWNETIIFTSFPLEKMVDMAMEAIIYETDGQSMECPLAEVMIPMATIDPSNGREWWPLFVLSDLPPVPQYPVYGNLNLSDNQLAQRLNQQQQMILPTIPNIQGSRSMPGSRRNSGRGIDVGPLIQGTMSVSSSPTPPQDGRHMFMYHQQQHLDQRAQELYQQQQQNINLIGDNNLIHRTSSLRTRHGSIMDIDSQYQQQQMVGHHQVNVSTSNANISQQQLDLTGFNHDQRRASSSSQLQLQQQQQFNSANYVT